jgi:hypothetical protein
VARKVVDLDILRTEPQFIKLGGKEIDVSFIPTAITFDIDTIVNRLNQIGVQAMSAGGDETKEAFDLTVKLCATFCLWKYPEMDEEWFRENTDASQLRRFAEVIQQTLQKAYAGVEEYQKNGEAVKVTA